MSVSAYYVDRRSHDSLLAVFAGEHRLALRFVLVRAILVLALAAVPISWARDAHQYSEYGIDDASITLVYASNLARGHGFVYNVGGERVEGQTSLLWVFICALFFLLVEHPEPLVLMTSVLLFVATHTLAATYVERQFGGGRWWLPAGAFWIYLLMVLFWPAHVTWMTITLMETPLWGFLLTASTIFLLTESGRNERRSSILFAGLISLTLVTRPESLFICVALLMVRTLQRASLAGSVHAGLRSAVLPGLAYLVVVGALTIFRMTYFGFPLPNTYYAKVGPGFWYNVSTGLRYYQQFVDSSPVIEIIVLVVVPSLRISSFGSSDRCAQAAAGSLTHLLSAWRVRARLRPASAG